MKRATEKCSRFHTRQTHTCTFHRPNQTHDNKTSYIVINALALGLLFFFFFFAVQSSRISFISGCKSRKHQKRIKRWHDDAQQQYTHFKSQEQQRKQNQCKNKWKQRTHETKKSVRYLIDLFRSMRWFMFIMEKRSKKKKRRARMQTHIDLCIGFHCAAASIRYIRLYRHSSICIQKDTPGERKSNTSAVTVLIPFGRFIFLSKFSHINSKFECCFHGTNEITWLIRGIISPCAHPFGSLIFFQRDFFDIIEFLAKIFVLRSMTSVQEEWKFVNRKSWTIRNCYS